MRYYEEAGDDGADSTGDDGGAEATAEVERRASEMGWSPKDKWRGKPELWIDAAEFVKRGETVMPILQANNRKLEKKVADLEGQLAKTNQLLAASNESVKALVEFNNDVTRRQAEDDRKKLIQARKEARDAGNDELELQLDEQIEEATSAIKTAKADKGKEKETPAATPNPAESPEFKSWKADNPWFTEDPVKAAAATEIGRQLRAKGDTTGGRAFFDKVTAEVNKAFNVHQEIIDQNAASKVEGGGSHHSSGNGNGSGTPRGKSYNDLPADAKAVCDRQANDLVGEGRAFKDVNAWRKHYVTKYFE